MKSSGISDRRHGPGVRRGIAAALAASHPGPSLVVTLVALALGVRADLPSGRLLLVVAAVLAGQLSIGWSNDLIDVRRDRATGRRDKPLATAAVGLPAVRAACATAVVTTVVLSLACGWAAGAVHLGAVAAGWAYNLALKSSFWSWLPFGLAFGALPVFVFLARPSPTTPPWWLPAAAGVLGVGAHLLNALPDLADDEAMGVRGLPHRLGPEWTARVATGLLVSASLLATLVAPSARGPGSWLTLALVLVLAVVGLTGAGRTPFRAAMAIALVDVLALTWLW